MLKKTNRNRWHLKLGRQKSKQRFLRDHSRARKMINKPGTTIVTVGGSFKISKDGTLEIIHQEDNPRRSFETSAQKLVKIINSNKFDDRKCDFKPATKHKVIRKGSIWSDSVGLVYDPDENFSQSLATLRRIRDRKDNDTVKLVRGHVSKAGKNKLSLASRTITYNMGR